MKQIEIWKCKIDSENRIALIFDYDTEIIAIVKQIMGRKWSKERRFWHIPCQEEIIINLKRKYGDKFDIRIKNESILEQFIVAMTEKNYSDSTIKTYRQYLQRFLNFFPTTKIENITSQQIREYLLYLIEKKKYSTSAQNQVVNAIGLYYREVLKRSLDKSCLIRPRREKKLPKTITENDVKMIFRQIDDLRTKCMAFFIYSAGLTPSELTYLKISDIDSTAKKVFISSRLGDKDRTVILSEKLLYLLRSYFKKYQPKYWLFEQAPKIQFSKNIFQKKLQIAVRKSGINKEANATILKNSFASHLIEKGIDIRFVQQILGHKNSKTTMRYLQVSKRDFTAITSPLDDLDL